jgi:hypothetical protein
MIIRDDGQNVITAMYCKMLVLLGLAFPMAETLTDMVPSGYYKGFLFYLFSGSLLFLLYVYIELWRFKATAVAEKKKTWLKDLRKGLKGLKLSTIVKKRKRRQSIAPEVEDEDIPRPKNVYGSLYLRLGAVSMLIGPFWPR